MNEFLDIPLAALTESDNNPREHFSPARMVELVDSIKTKGVLQPILVRPLPGHRVATTGRGVTHEIIAGARRFRASNLAGLATISAIVCHLDDRAAMEAAIIENLQRDDLSALEEAQAFQRLMQHPETHLTADQVAAKVGKSRRHVFHRLSLLKMRSESREALLNGQVDHMRAMLLARIPDHQQQIKALTLLAEREVNGEYKLNYSQAAAMVERDFMLDLGKARFMTTDATLLPDAGNCMACSKRTGHDPDLFADVKSANVCTDPPCFHKKQEAHEVRILQQAEKNGQTVITGREAKALMPNDFGPIDGFLRLDDAADSPTDKPLRKLLGNLMEKDDIKPTLIDNPHKKGELIAVLKADTVAGLLKKRNHKNEAAALEGKVNASAKQQAEVDKQAKKVAFEQAWRSVVMAAAWTRIANGHPPGQDLTRDLMRYLALHLADGLNIVRTRELCRVLDLGKIAPGQALKDYITAHKVPEQILLLLVMHRDSEYHEWQDDPLQANAGLLMVVNGYGIDVEEAKVMVKANIRAAKTPVPADSTNKGAGGKAETASPAKPARKSKLSAEAATTGIAGAMQELENKAAEASGLISQPAGALAVGQAVTITSDEDRLQMRLRKWAGKKGTVTAQIGPDAWDVTFKGRTGGLAGFASSELVPA